MTQLYRSIIVITLLLLTLLGGCAVNNNKNTPQLNSNQSAFFYIQDNANNAQTYQQANWSITAQVTDQQNKPKINLYDFTVHSNSEKFTISDINYKYGNYGKWRIIEKKNYLTSGSNKRQSITIKDFPITIKKINTPHNQLLQFTIKMENNQTKMINLIFGIQKCIAKNEKEFVCF